jgi:hypothetical protein
LHSGELESDYFILYTAAKLKIAFFKGLHFCFLKGAQRMVIFKNKVTFWWYFWTFLGCNSSVPLWNAKWQKNKGKGQWQRVANYCQGIVSVMDRL